MTPNDVLVVINHINAHPRDFSLPPTPVSPPPFPDVGGNGRCTPSDVPAVINEIIASAVPAAEAEGATQGTGWTAEVTASLLPALAGAAGPTVALSSAPAAANSSDLDQARSRSTEVADEPGYTSPPTGYSVRLASIRRHARAPCDLQDRDAQFLLWGEGDDPGLESGELGFQF